MFPFQAECHLWWDVHVEQTHRGDRGGEWEGGGSQVWRRGEQLVLKRVGFPCLSCEVHWHIVCDIWRNKNWTYIYWDVIIILNRFEMRFSLCPPHKSLGVSHNMDVLHCLIYNTSDGQFIHVACGYTTFHTIFSYDPIHFL